MSTARRPDAGRPRRASPASAGFCRRRRPLGGGQVDPAQGALSGPPAGRRRPGLYGGVDLTPTTRSCAAGSASCPQDDVLYGELGLRPGLLEFAGRGLRSRPDALVRRGPGRPGRRGAGRARHRGSRRTPRRAGSLRRRAQAHERRPGAVDQARRLLLPRRATSGLDPGYGRALMELLRELADGADRRRRHPRAGQPVGLRPDPRPGPGRGARVRRPADRAPERFGDTDLVDVFGHLAATEHVDWHVGRSAGSVPTVDVPFVAAPAADAPEPTPPPAPESARAGGSQLRTLTARYVEVLAADRRNAALLLLHPILGVLILAALPAGDFGAPPATELRLVCRRGDRALRPARGRHLAGRQQRHPGDRPRAAHAPPASGPRACPCRPTWPRRPSSSAG